MKLALYVHDLKLEIGHSNSLIELVRHLPEDYLGKFDELEVVTYTTTPLTELFPGFKGRLKWTRVPSLIMKPFIFKSIFYQLWTKLYNRLFQSKETLRIGIGISCLDVQAVSVQFIHHQWTEKGLEQESAFWLRKLYKRFLFGYYEWCEDYLFSRKGLKVFSPAAFLTQFLESKYPGLKGETIYSGVNLSRFNLSTAGKPELLRDLQTRYPALSNLDINRPIFLFVGAYERKGLDEAIELLRPHKGAQFIVIGSPSFGKKVDWPENLKVFPISFTREVPLFYALADAFIFPTIYEPFGLVLFEAMAMGLTIITHRQGVGASELLAGLPEVYFSDEKQFTFPEVKVKGLVDRSSIREARLKYLGDVSWKSAGERLSSYLVG